MIQKPIPYGHQYITAEDIEAVNSALRSDYLTQGPCITEFEDKFAEYIGCKYAVAVANGTAALHLSAMALNVKPGDKVITTPITFVASANCVRYRAVNLEEFRKVADEYGLWILEDACHAPGGYFLDSNQKEQFCGNGQYTDLAIFSFHPVKHIACGEGGMITTNDKELYKKLLLLRTHGITKGDSEFPYENSIEFASGGYENEKDYPGWYMEMQQLGYNYRLTDFQAALGTSQLKRADVGLNRRREIAESYYNAFKDKKYIIGQSGVVEGHAYHLYVIEAEDRLNLYKYLRANNIYAQIHYIPAHLMPYYRQFGYTEGDLPIAENYYKHCISIPMFPTLTDEEQQYVIKIIDNFYKK